MKPIFERALAVWNDLSLSEELLEGYHPARSRSLFVVHRCLEESAGQEYTIHWERLHDCLPGGHCSDSLYWATLVATDYAREHPRATSVVAALVLLAALAEPPTAEGHNEIEAHENDSAFLYALPLLLEHLDLADTCELCVVLRGVATGYVGETLALDLLLVALEAKMAMDVLSDRGVLGHASSHSAIRASFMTRICAFAHQSNQEEEWIQAIESLINPLR